MVLVVVGQSLSSTASLPPPLCQEKNRKCERSFLSSVTVSIRWDHPTVAADSGGTFTLRAVAKNWQETALRQSPIRGENSDNFNMVTICLLACKLGENNAGQFTKVDFVLPSCRVEDKT